MTEVASGHRPPGVVTLVFGRYSDYVWGLRPLFTICLLLFTFSLVMGFHLGDRIPGELLEEVMGSFPDVESLSFPMLFLFIFANNVFKSFLWMVLGVLFSAPSLFFTVLNGFIVGWFSHSIAMERGLTFTAAALIPHGVIEIPTILLSSAAGMALGYQLINRLRGRGGLRAELGRALRLFIWRIVPLLLFSALVEVTVTPMVILLLGLG